MHEYPLLEILAAGFTFALLFGYLAQRVGLTPILGYLVAGFLVGPLTPGFVADMHLATELSEAGVILLMFGVGLHFHMEDLLALKGISLPGAIFQSTCATLCGVLIGHVFGLPLASGLVLGMGLSVASTVVLLRVLTDNHMLDTVHGHVAVGWLVVEDIFTVVILVLLPSLALISGGGAEAAQANGGAAPLLKAFGLAMFRLVALWVLVLVVGGRVVPWVLKQVVRTRSQELFTLAVLVLAFATAVGAAVFFQASMALGAFLGGMVVGKTRISNQAGADILPFKDAFAVLFFMSVGMLFDPMFIVREWWLVLAALGVVLLVKPLAAMLIVSFLGYSARTGLVVGVSLAQVGEFSFIMAQVAHNLKIVPVDIYNVLVACAIVSITLNSSFFKAVPVMERFLEKHGRIWRFLNWRADHKASKKSASLHPAHGHSGRIQAVVVGYGPIGRNVHEAIKGKGLSCSVVEMNADTVNALNDEGQFAVFGNSSRSEVLVAAGVDKADYLIITLPMLEDVLTTAGTARNLNEKLRILARARFLKDRELLKTAGINAAAFEEEETAHTLATLVTEHVHRCEEGLCPNPFYDTDETEITAPNPNGPNAPGGLAP